MKEDTAAEDLIRELDREFHSMLVKHMQGEAASFVSMQEQSGIMDWKRLCG